MSRADIDAPAITVTSRDWIDASLIPVPTVLILNPIVRLTVYGYLSKKTVQTKIFALSRRERQLLEAVAATRATKSTLEKLMLVRNQP